MRPAILLAVGAACLAISFIGGFIYGFTFSSWLGNMENE